MMDEQDVASGRTVMNGRMMVSGTLLEIEVVLVSGEYMEIVCVHGERGSHGERIGDGA